MKCPNCKKEIEDWRGECPYCKNSTDENNQSTKKGNAYYLNILTYINIALTIISSLAMCIYPFIREYENKVIFIISGVIVAITGSTFFFLLNTILDIYKKVNK